MAAVLDQPPHLLTRLLSAPATSQLHQLILYAIAISILFRIYCLVHNDYHAFLALGPGGTPSTFKGYLRVSWLRLFAHKNPFIPPPLMPEIIPASGYLLRLPRRFGPRPTVAGIAPQRQRDQIPPRHIHQAMTRALHSLADSYPSIVGKGASCFEKYGLALFLTKDHEARNPGRTEQPDSTRLNDTCEESGEFCHLHSSETSMHLTLHPSDAALVISHGWGQRHPLAGRKVHPLGREIFGRTLLPAGFVMVYAPTDESQIGVLMEIVRAAGWWVGGIGLGEGGRRGVGVLTRGGEEGSL
ncbi:MAG: hypothetical protein HETSPECPRED_010200 [Heterodermia speciosa]|uniref:Luciferase domain-containing protein n=1 Tax=Heterodermia speciosa TaxID=116794 RepID=A0A8H3I116_9LECA|nr:MAG: hypothetical protein HETSPECPRED_010200 [Heterodermia speciosa]